MNNKLDTGDSFPAMSLTLTDGQQVSLPAALEPGSYQVVLFFRGKFWPYCIRQLGGFGENFSKLQKLNTQIIAASSDNLDNSTAIAADLPYPVAHSASKDHGDKMGSWWEERRGLIQPSGFVLNHEGKVLSATYSSAAIGRIDGADAVKFITFQEKLRQEA